MLAVYSGVLLSVALCVMATGPAFCKRNLKRCLLTKSEVSCNSTFLGCLRRYCDTVASYSKTAKITAAKRTACYVRTGIYVLIDK
ncbi:hypothetical protein ScPMuIL_016669 [Solemya velum]